MGPGRPPSRIFTPEEEEEIFDRIESGELLRPIAEDLGMTQPSFMRWCDKPIRSARVKNARRNSALANIEDAERQLRNAGDPFELAKADKLGYHLRWKASKANPREYGDKIDHAISGTLNIEQIRRVVIDSKAPVAEAGTSD